MAWQCDHSIDDEKRPGDFFSLGIKGGLAAARKISAKVGWAHQGAPLRRSNHQTAKPSSSEGRQWTESTPFCIFVSLRALWSKFNHVSHGFRWNDTRNTPFGLRFEAGRQTDFFRNLDRHPAPVSAKNGTALSRGLLGALRELVALGIRVALDEVVAGSTTGPHFRQDSLRRLVTVVSD